ncbi:MAG: site-specific integrase [Nanoarchaeota archaeon]
MAEDDIYHNERIYGRFKKNLDQFVVKPEERQEVTKRGKYYCKNKDNLVYFEQLFKVFEAKDLSYVRRNRLLMSMRLICNSTDKDLKDLEREDVNSIVSFMHTSYKSPKSKSDFIRDLKHMWKVLFPEKDERERIDDTLVPYPVRHLSPKIDKSKEKRRGDKVTFEEFEKVVSFFSNDPRMQFYLTLSLESLGRPQEILYTKVKDVELYDNYAKIWISEHGKEGTGFLQCIDSYPYLIKWLEQHPLKKNKDAFLFVNLSDREFGQQFKPKNINNKIHTACKYLGIEKPVTAYSLKRNGVTFRRLRGDSDLEIQHAARWTSNKQLKTYDLSQHDESFKIELVKRGLVQDEKYKELQPKIKDCLFCNVKNGFTSETCNNCKRPLDRTKIQDQMQKYDNFMQIPEVQKLFKIVSELQKEIKELKN